MYMTIFIASVASFECSINITYSPIQPTFPCTNAVILVWLSLHPMENFGCWGKGTFSSLARIKAHPLEWVNLDLNQLFIDCKYAVEKCFMAFVTICASGARALPAQVTKLGLLCNKKMFYI